MKTKQERVDSLVEFMKDIITDVLDNQKKGVQVEWTNSRHLMEDGRLCIYIGWSGGYDENDDSIIHDLDEPNWGLAMKIAEVNNFDWVDFDFLNQPWDKTGDVYDSQLTLSPFELKDGVVQDTAEWFIKTYDDMVELLDDNKLFIE